MITQNFQIKVICTLKKKKLKTEQLFFFSVSEESFAAITIQCDQFYQDFKTQYLILANGKFAKVEFECDNI